MWLILIVSVIAFIGQAEAGRCPSTHPYAYYNGDHCCASNLEKRHLPQGGACDGSQISWDSLCCEDDRQVACSDRPCYDRTEENRCPASHPYAYHNGEYCCQTGFEKVHWEQGSLCDGGPIDWDSLCCEDNQYIECDDPPCLVTYDSPAEPQVQPTSSVMETDVSCNKGQSDCYVYCQVITSDEIDTKGMELCKVKPDGGVGHWSKMTYSHNDEFFSKKIFTKKASAKTYMCRYQNHAMVVINVTVA